MRDCKRRPFQQFKLGRKFSHHWPSRQIAQLFQIESITKRNDELHVEVAACLGIILRISNCALRVVPIVA